MSTPTENLNMSTDTGGTPDSTVQPDVMLQVTDEPEQTTTNVTDPATPGAPVTTLPVAGEPDPAKPDVRPIADTAGDPAAPILQREVPVESKPHDLLAPIFDTYDKPESAVTAAIKSLDDLHAYDQPAYYALANGLYHSNKAWFEERALTEAGIPQEKIAEFREYVKSGAELPAAAPLRTFPALDAHGVAVFDGIEYRTKDEYGEDNDVGRALYNNAKELFELREGKRADDAQKLADQTKTADDAKIAEQTKTREAQESRVNTFTADRNAYVVNEVKEATKDYGSPLLQATAYSLVNQLMAGKIPEMLKNVPELKLAMERVGQLNALSNRAGQHIVNGDGRTADFAKAADAITKDLIAAALSPLNRMIQRSNQAERAVLAGQPKIPSTTVTAGTQTGNTGEKPKTEAEIEKRLQTGIATKFGG